MTDPPRFVIAYWLLPAAPARDFFEGTIRRLALEYDAPLFAPHLTLGVGPDDWRAAGEALARLAAVSIEARVLEVAFAAKFTKTLFVRFDPSPALRQLRVSLGLERDNAFDPHVSLLYKKLSERQQARLASEIHPPFAAVLFDRVEATRCRLPVAEAGDVAVWESIATRRLRGSSEDAGRFPR